jgi:hypothetical protein
VSSLRRINITTASGDAFIAELTCENPVTAKAVWEKLPIEGKAKTWGDEIYFTIPVTCNVENPRELVYVGEVAYWPPGDAICIFFGPTPISGNGEIRPASPVNVFAKIVNNLKLLKLVRSGETVRIEKA